ncbi:uncharacterized protein [Rutidosis leptorrhynchoides]|uniref:uncharacterized protein n=1 Tax=Rutidosis leptorrhynchoides TaxID=125765 RepID=UPI003A9A4ACA
MFSSVQSQEVTALYSKASNGEDKCQFCGHKWHSPDKCWEKIGYPPWHYKSRFNAKRSTQVKPKAAGHQNLKKTAANAQGNNVIFTSEKFEQLLRCLPQMTQNDVNCVGADTDEEVDHFAAGIISNTKHVNKWILDSGATDHMTYDYDSLHNLKSLTYKPHIRLPNGNTSDLKTKKVIRLGERKDDLYYLINVPMDQVDKRLFDKQIKVVRSDNALEFVSGKLGAYSANLGIVHQASCPDRPQQNGRVERKHRHILKIARALRIPSSVLANKTPYEVLFDKAPCYDNLRVFGYLDFASNPARNVDKFSARGVPFVFLGYPAHQKGYVLYNLSTKSVFVSRDVEFKEHIFPFHEETIKKLLQPIPVPLSSAKVVYDDCIHSTSNMNVQIESQPESQQNSQPDSQQAVQSKTLEPAVSNDIPTQSESLNGSTRNLHAPSWHKDYFLNRIPRANQVSTPSLDSSFQKYVTALMATADPTLFKEAINDPEWCNAMNMELAALELNDT